MNFSNFNEKYTIDPQRYAGHRAIVFADIDGQMFAFGMDIDNIDLGAGTGVYPPLTIDGHLLGFKETMDIANDTIVKHIVPDTVKRLA